MAADKQPIWRVDAKACLKGGEVAGRYLDEIGKTDLAALTRDEWETFCVKAGGRGVPRRHRRRARRSDSVLASVRQPQSVPVAIRAGRA
jgi:hypothetical protein